MAKKGLNDVIHGDRANVRAAHVPKTDRYEDWLDDGYSKGSTKTTAGGSTFAVAPRCYETHPALTLPGADKVIYGGSCSAPVVHDADVYVGLDYSMKLTAKGLPWKATKEVYFPVQDMGVPTDSKEFADLIAWLHAMVEEGKKVHVGCIGGHGRTGMLLAALVTRYGEMDAVNYVRKLYCKKAVESTSQIAFLVEHFGVTKVDAVKGWVDAPKTGKSKGSVTHYEATPAQKGVEHFAPLGGNGRIWG